MSGSTLVQVGSLSIPVSQLRVGQLKRARAELELLLAMRRDGATMPSAEQIDAMVTIVHVSASAVDPSLTREVIQAAVDDAPYDTGLKELAAAIGVVMERSGVSTAPGEAQSPATDASISSGSTA